MHIITNRSTDPAQLTQQFQRFSFGIICAQLVTKSSAWDLDNRKEDASEILYLVKKGGHNQQRPALSGKDDLETNPALVSQLEAFARVASYTYCPLASVAQDQLFESTG
ncbi:hypothetical protein TELCIR_00148 [Teladorsagia circumcincta]|uniref:Uncharacterized protein n=1 Tax=Teladorsagia circumcincta TaxID=45464 RepID=A0A2G9V5H9_TELCI|nr:hypothetical protein TELCIR_00148 [Teladorsagia circumcincta]